MPTQRGAAEGQRDSGTWNWKLTSSHCEVVHLTRHLHVTLLNRVDMGIILEMVKLVIQVGYVHLFCVSVCVCACV